MGAGLGVGGLGWAAAEEFEAVGDEVEAEALGDGLDEGFVGFVAELDDAAGLDVDQMVVLAVFGGFVAGASAAEVAAFEDAAFLEEADGAVDGGDGHARVEGGSARR